MTQYQLQKISDFGKDLARAFERDLFEGVVAERLNAADLMHVISTGLAVLWFGTNVESQEDRDFYMREMMAHAEIYKMRLELELQDRKQ